MAIDSGGRLEDRAALITGAGSGIGRESALLFAAEGAHVAVCERDERSGRETVEQILDDIDRRGDTAVRELSRKFDDWAPDDFFLSPAQIEAAKAQVADRDLEDIAFAQSQVRNFAASPRAMVPSWLRSSITNVLARRSRASAMEDNSARSGSMPRSTMSSLSLS